MTLLKRLTTIMPDRKRRRLFFVMCLLSVCVLLCGFSWGWVIEFTMPILYPADEAVDSAMILGFDGVVNTDDLTGPLIAEQLIDGIRANVSGNVYSDIEIPDMREETLGSKIIRVIFDRLFT